MDAKDSIVLPWLVESECGHEDADRVDCYSCILRCTDWNVGRCAWVGDSEDVCVNPEHVLPQILLRSWPFPRGAGRIIDRWFNDLCFTAETAKVRTTDNFSMTVMPNDLIGKHIYLTGEFDRSTAEVLLGLARPGDTLLDIAANIGYVSCCFLKNIPRSSVIAVDPQPEITSLLRQNLFQFGYGRSTIFEVGLSDKDHSGWQEICSANRGASKIVSDQNASSVEIKIWSAKTFFRELGDRNIDLVKIDVEGHEEAVLRACKHELQRLRPRAIVFEDHTRSAAPEGVIGKILTEIGYGVSSIQKRLTRLDFIPVKTAADCNSVDYLAQPATQ